MSANPATAVAVIDPLTSIQVNLDAWPEDKFNRLIPTQTIRMPSDLFVPVIQVVQLDPPDRDGKSADHYKSSDVPQGHRAPTARALNKFASAAGISFFDERRLDDGTDPDVMGVTLMAAMLLPTGQRVTAPGSQLINLRTWFGSQTSQAELAKFRKQFYAHVSTRAKNRAIRGILSLRASYPDAVIAKPFAVVSYAPNLNHPAVQARYLDAMVPAIEAGFGPDRSRQLVAGPAVTVLPEAPEVDEADEDQVAATAPQTPSDDVPDWARPSDGAATPVAAARPLHEALSELAEASGLQGPAQQPQKDKLRELIGGLDWTSETIPVLTRAFGDEAARSLTAGQAQAILNAADSFQSVEAFLEAWRRAAA